MKIIDILDEIKQFIKEANEQVAEVYKQREEDLVAQVTQDAWESSVDIIKSYDCIRYRLPQTSRFLGAIKTNGDRFYEALKSLGPMTLTKLSKFDIDKYFMKTSFDGNMQYQTFFNGYPVAKYKFDDSFAVIRDEQGTVFAYLPIVSSMIHATREEIVESLKNSKMHFSSMYVPSECDMFSWYMLTENNKKKSAHEDDFYEDKIKTIKVLCRERIKAKVIDLADAYKTVSNTCPTSDGLEKLLASGVTKIPDEIGFGSCKIETEQGTIRFPQLRAFPFKKAMWFGDEDLPVLHALYLRLLCSLPIGKVEFTVYDPNGLGSKIANFNLLFTENEIFPAKGSISLKKMITEELHKALLYVQQIHQEIFDADCNDWASYNAKMAKENPRKILPYKIFTFFDMPDDLDQDSIECIQKLIRHSYACGMLILFSYKSVNPDAQKDLYHALQGCINDSVNLSDALCGVDDNFGIVGKDAELGIEIEDEHIESITTLKQILTKYVRENQEAKKVSFDFNLTMNKDHLFEQVSANGLEFTLGYKAETGDAIKVALNDEHTHYLVGGTTGSGKSNLLHNMIMSACCRYSPKELQLYMLDFKQAVEFNKYRKPLLPHVKLLAVESDTEYGMAVLKQIMKEHERRTNIFKEADCSSIVEYRAKNPTVVMPRIMVVMDEFQNLIRENMDKAIDELTNQLKLVRSSGIHFILATQSIMGLHFDTVYNQIGGYIILNCNANDAQKFMGGCSSNVEPALIKRPFAILNTERGNKEGNIKVAIPHAITELIHEGVACMREQAEGTPIEEPIIFEGKKFPEHPAENEFHSESPGIILGRTMNVCPETFIINFLEKKNSNIAAIVTDDVIKCNMIKSIILSVLNSKYYDEFIYVGNDKSVSSLCFDDNVHFFKTMQEYMDYMSDAQFDALRMVVFDNWIFCDEYGFDEYEASSSKLPANAQCAAIYLSQMAIRGSHCVAFYSELSTYRANRFILGMFGFKIGYEMQQGDVGDFIESYSSVKCKEMKQRCFLANKGEIIQWFKPFVSE